jgi:hypothetical protein
MNWNSTRGISGRAEPRRWLTSALEGSDSRSLERYLHDIEQELEHGLIKEALELSAMLPEMCSMLEHPQMRTSPAHCVCWCDAWVVADSNSRNVFPLTRIYLREENAELAQWISEDAQFARSVSQSLLDAARSWYQQRGAYDLTVQYNLGKICGS